MNEKKNYTPGSKELIFDDIQSLKIDSAEQVVLLRELTLSLYHGSQKAWEELYLMMYDSLAHFICRIVRSHEEASDITQEVFITLWENHPKINPEKNIKGYLYAIARTLAYRHLRDRSKKSEYASLAEIPEPGIFDITPDDIIVADEIRILIALALEKMPAQRRQVFKMSRMEGLSYDEIAQKLNLSRRTVEAHVYHVTRELKTLLSAAAAFLGIEGLML